MSRNVETLLAMYEAFNQRKFDDAVRFAHSEVELYPGLEGPDTGKHYRGRDGLKQFLETISDVWDAQTVEPREIVEGAENKIREGGAMRNQH